MNSSIESLGLNPINLNWKIVRGDTASLRIDFCDFDESPWDTDDYSYSSTAYNRSDEAFDELEVESGYGYAIITAPAALTALWGTEYGSVVAEIPFDLQVTISGPNNTSTVWTPVVGTISVQADVTEGGLL